MDVAGRNIESGRSYGCGSWVRRSFAPTSQCAVAPSGTGHPMRYGDEIEVRLIVGSAVVEFTERCVNDFSELLGVARRQAAKLHGLAKLYVTNRTRAWRLTRPLMLYVGRVYRINESAKSREIPQSVRMLFCEH